VTAAEEPGVDRLVALAARDDLLWIAAHWADLAARLRPGGGSALTGVSVSTSDDARLPIDVHVSDLMHEIEENVARFYGHILADETDWTPTTSAMPGLLREVAQRYGHFTTDDDAMALGFCDDANDYRERVRKTLERPAPPAYVGPCQGDNCDGELYLREGREAGTCRACGRPFTHVEQREFIADQLTARLMTRSEILRALKVIDTPRTPSTFDGWVRRGELIEAGDGLYHFDDARQLALRGRGRPAKVAA
jgi:hypothetical protein